MKLYTEKQVRRAMLHSYLSGVERPPDYLPIEESILNELTPIELPSDEEILEQSIKRMEEWYGSGSETEIDAHNSGAKWMKEQILNQNK